MAKTLYEKLFDAHVVYEAENETPLLYIDRHLVHEVTSPQAFDGLRAHGRPVRQPGKTFATMDHNVSTQTKDINACGEMARIQMQELIKNCKEFGVELYDLNHPYQGIVHVMGPEQGVTLPGMTIVCGDSHTATHGAFGALAFGIGTSEVEHVLATQTLKQGRAKTMKIEVQGKAAPGITAKDIVLAIIGKTGSAGGTGHVVEFCGEAIRDLSMEGRMTLCNMAIEMGAKAGLVAPDETTFNYVKGRLHAPKGKDFDDAVAYWKTLQTDEGATFDTVVTLQAEEIAPQVTWGTNPGQVISVKENGLVWAAHPSYAMTWMDAVVDGHPVTGREGFQVEINALWYNAICYTLALARKFRDKTFVAAWEAMPTKIQDSFINLFWLQDKNYLADYVDENGPNRFVRPNQIVACSLRYKMLSEEQQLAVIATVKKHLLTPKGLRTLSPQNPLYVGRYEGDQPTRDRAYHQGTVWVWPLEHYVQANFDLFGKSFIPQAEEILTGFDEDISSYGIGSIAEIYDGDPPHAQRGAISQAWSVGALLRIEEMIQTYRRKRK